MNNTPPIIDTGAESKAPEFAPDPQAQTFVAPEPENKKGNVGTIIFAILFFIAVAAAGYFFYSNMETNKQVDDLTKKNKDLTSQLAAAGEKEEVADDVTGELLAEVNGKYDFTISEFKNGLDGSSEIMLMNLTERELGTGFARYYYRAKAGAEWKLIAEGQAEGECLYYDGDVAAAFGENLPCIAPAAEEGEETEPTEDKEPVEEEAAEGTDSATE